MPIFVDLDVGQNSITIPGVLAAVSIDRPFPLEVIRKKNKGN